MFGRSKRVLALDIGSSEIKALEVQDSGSGLTLTGFASTRIGNQNETIYAIKEILRHAGFKSKRTITSVSGRAVIVRYVTMAQMPEEDLKQAIRFEADKYIPLRGRRSRHGHSDPRGYGRGFESARDARLARRGP